MNRVRRLYGLWGWLPAFRVVAETEHLPTASEQLGITPQALSRSIKLLEKHLESELFDRVGRRLHLTDAGRELLEHVRASMRNLDDGISAVTGVNYAEAAHIAAHNHHAWLLVQPAIGALARVAPSLVPHVHNATGPTALDAVRKGTCDVAIGEFAVTDSAIVIEPLTRLRSDVFCGHQHPLAEKSRVPREELAAFPFVVPVGDESDGWPVSEDRTIGARVSSFQLALELCASGDYLAMLPTAVQAAGRHNSRLQRVAVDIWSERDVFVAYRRPVGQHRVTQVLLKALHQAAANLRLPQS